MPRAKKAKKAVTPADAQAEEINAAAADKQRKTANSAAATADAETAAAAASAGAGGGATEAAAEPAKKPKKLTKKQLKAASAAAEEAADLAMLNHATAELKAGSAMTDESAAAAAKEKMDDAKLAAEMASALASSSSAAAVDANEPAAAAAAAPRSQLYNGRNAVLDWKLANDDAKSSAAAAAAAAAVPAAADAKDVKSSDKTLEQKLADIARAKAAVKATEMTPTEKLGQMFEKSDEAKLGCWMPFERHVRRVQVMVEQRREAQGGWKVKPIHFNFQEAFFRELQGYVQQFMNGLFEKAVDLMVPMGGVQVMMKHIRLAMFQDASPMGGTYRAMALPITVRALGGYDPRRPLRVDAKGEVTAINHDAAYNSVGHPRARERIIEEFVDLLTERTSGDKKDGKSDYVDGLSSRSLRALSKANAAQSMSHCCYDELRAIVTTFIWDAMVKITEIAAGANRKTIFVDDLVRASEKVWRTLLLTPETHKKRKHAADDDESPSKKVKRDADEDAVVSESEPEDNDDTDAEGEGEDADAEGEGEDADEKASDS